MWQQERSLCLLSCSSAPGPPALRGAVMAALMRAVLAAFEVPGGVAVPVKEGPKEQMPDWNAQAQELPEAARAESGSPAAGAGPDAAPGSPSADAAAEPSAIMQPAAAGGRDPPEAAGPQSTAAAAAAAAPKDVPVPVAVSMQPPDEASAAVQVAGRRGGSPAAGAVTHPGASAVQPLAGASAEAVVDMSTDDAAAGQPSAGPSTAPVVDLTQEQPTTDARQAPAYPRLQTRPGRSQAGVAASAACAA